MNDNVLNNTENIFNIFFITDWSVTDFPLFPTRAISVGEMVEYEMFFKNSLGYFHYRLTD